MIAWQMTAAASATVVCEVFAKQQRHDGECVCVHVCMREASSVKLGLLRAPLTEVTKVLFLC